MKEIVILDDRYSTTRCVRKEAADVMAAELKAAQKPEDQFETLLFLPEGEGRQGEGGLRMQGYFKETKPEKPLITVVTVVFNGAQFLEETILSVINQTYDNVEYIVIDGGSMDGTLEIIRKYEHAIDYWVSEKDGGIYDAMNKGIKLANGGIVGLINSDDYYYKYTLKLVSDASKNSDADIFFGDKLSLNEDLKMQKTVSVDIPVNAKKMALNNVHPAVFIKRIIYKIHLFNPGYKIAGDYDFLLRVFDAGYRIKKIPKILSVMRTGGASSVPNLESVLIRRKRFGFWAAALHFLKLIGRRLMVRIFGYSCKAYHIKRMFYLKRGWYDSTQ